MTERHGYGMLYAAQKEICAENTVEDVCSLCGVGEYGKATAVVRITAVGVDAPDSMRDFKKI